MPRNPLRWVIEVGPYGYRRKIVKLNCGHEIVRKASEVRPGQRHMACPDCGYRERGGTVEVKPT